MRVPVVGLGSIAATSYTVPPYGSKTFETQGNATSQLLQGWAHIAPESGSTISAVATFRTRTSGEPDFEVVAPALPDSRRLMFPFDNTSGFVSSMAIVNTGTAGSISMLFRDENGAEIASRVLPDFVSGEHWAFVLWDAFPALVNRRGTIEVTSLASPTPAIVGLVLRFNPTGPIALLPPSFQGN